MSWLSEGAYRTALPRSCWPECKKHTTSTQHVHREPDSQYYSYIGTTFNRNQNYCHNSAWWAFPNGMDRYPSESRWPTASLPLHCLDTQRGYMWTFLGCEGFPASKTHCFQSPPGKHRERNGESHCLFFDEMTSNEFWKSCFKRSSPLSLHIISM